MDQAYALATGSAYALLHGFTPVVEKPLKPHYGDCTSYSTYSLADATMTSLMDTLSRRGGGVPQHDVTTALHELVATLSAMADGTAHPRFYLSSLDPGVGKTTSLVHFVQELLRSEQHDDVAVLLCFSRLEEIARLVAEMCLIEADFAVFTSDDQLNRLSSTPPNRARVLFTTHAMVMSRCRGERFQDVSVFHYMGEVWAVRVWDEAMLPGEVVSLTTDQLASLRDPLRFSHPALTELIEELEGKLRASAGQGVFVWPDVEAVTAVSLLLARRGLEQRHVSYLDTLYALSGRCVLLRKPHNASTVITALDSRDALPDDLAPILILDASGRVRATYEQWEKRKGNLIRLPTAAKSYKNLTVHVMDIGAGKTTWSKSGMVLAQHIAQLIDSKPDEDWLVIYHKGVNKGDIPDQIKGLLSSNPERVSFLNWGKHQATNEFRNVRNVVLAGLNNYSETDYEMMARYYGRVPSEQEAPKALVKEMEKGEHKHHILQALCRSSIRQASGSERGGCNAYIMAPKRSRIRELLPDVFPGCSLKTWQPKAVKAKGKVQQALTYVEKHFDDYPDRPLPFTELQSALQIKSTSNFRKTIRNHDCFIAGLESIGVEEVTVGNHRHRNALARRPQTFGPVPGSDYVVNV